MPRTLIGIVSFGNLAFTQLCVQSIRETVYELYDIFIVVGKPGDIKTVEWLNTEPLIKYKVHDKNMGFPYSLNDIYDYAWKENNYDNLIIAGNDTVAYPYCVDSLIRLANSSDYEVISATQYDVKQLTIEYPDVSKHFVGEKKIIKDFSQRPWDAFKNYSETLEIAEMKLFDIQNFCLYKKSIFDKIGYTDVGFYPAYFVDNDYARRIVISGVKCCSLVNARFFHFWSRTLHQETGGSNDKYFKNNNAYYRTKWGGDFGRETIAAPVYIGDRLLEEQIINSWRNK